MSTIPAPPIPPPRYIPASTRSRARLRSGWSIAVAVLIELSALVWMMTFTVYLMSPGIYLTLATGSNPLSASQPSDAIQLSILFYCGMRHSLPAVGLIGLAQLIRRLA